MVLIRTIVALRERGRIDRICRDDAGAELVAIAVVVAKEMPQRAILEHERLEVVVIGAANVVAANDACGRRCAVPI